MTFGPTIRAKIFSESSRSTPIGCCLVLACVALLGLGAGHPCVTVKVTNCAGRTVRMAFGPLTVCAVVRVQPHAEHRKLAVTWDYADDPSSMLDASPLVDTEDAENPFAMPELRNGVIGSAFDDLDGEQEPILIRPAGYKLESLSGGSYEVKAVVYRADGSACGSARTTVLVR